jgi:hypothetical protein
MAVQALTRKPAKKPVLLQAARQVSVIHRWLGIVLCLMIALWFFTGSVLSFVPFPSLSGAARLSGSEPVDFNRVLVGPAAAIVAAGAAPIEHVRLISVAGQPRYVVSLNGQRVVSVSASNGQIPEAITPAAARVIAEQFSGLKVTGLTGPFDFDQWTVHGAYNTYRPFYQLSMDDAAGTALYVSLRSGEVLQRTRRTERAWNYVGAVVHWINPTLLRKNYTVWRRVIWTLSLGGMVLVLAGMGLGLVRYINLKRQQRVGLSPFSGWLRWHHSIGLFAGVLVLSWVSTGWLSLDTGTFFSSDQPSNTHIESLRGMPLADAVKAFPIAAISKLGVAREIEFTALGGQPLLLVRNGEPQTARVVSIDAQKVLQVASVVPDSLVRSAVQAAWSPLAVLRMHTITADDAYSLRISPLPLTTRRVVLNDARQTWVQIDAATGQVISVLDNSRRVYRWLVDGLHTFDFPLLNRAGSLWHVLLLIGTTTGFVFSCTGIVLGVKRLRKALM